MNTTCTHCDGSGYEYGQLGIVICGYCCGTGNKTQPTHNQNRDNMKHLPPFPIPQGAQLLTVQDIQRAKANARSWWEYEKAQPVYHTKVQGYKLTLQDAMSECITFMYLQWAEEGEREILIYMLLWQLRWPLPKLTDHIVNTCYSLPTIWHKEGAGYTYSYTPESEQHYFDSGLKQVARWSGPTLGWKKRKE